MNSRAIDKIIYMWYFIIFCFMIVKFNLIQLFLIIYNHARYIFYILYFMQFNFTHTYCIKYNLMQHRTYVCLEWLAGLLLCPSARMVAGFSPIRSEMWDSQVVPTDSTTLGRVLRYFGIGA